MNKKKYKDVVIDTSSLNYILENHLTESFTTWVKSNKIRLIIPKFVFEEKISMADEKKIIQNLLSIGKILRILRHHYELFIFINDCFDLEFKNQLSSIPFESDYEKKRIAEIITSEKKINLYLKNRTDDEKRAACKWKEKTYNEFDMVVIKNLKLKQQGGDPFYSSKNIVELINKFNGLTHNFIILEKHIEEFNQRNNKRYSPEYIINNKKQFPHYYNWLCLSQLTALGLLHPKGGGEFIQALQSDKGNWYDNGIATSATLCDLFLTEDKNLAIKCNYLSNKNLVNFETKKLSEILTPQQ